MADADDLHGFGMYTQRLDDLTGAPPLLILSLTIWQEVDEGLSVVANVNSYVDGNWHDVRVTYGGSGYDPGTVINSLSQTRVWIDGTEQVGLLDYSASTYGAPDAVTGSAPLTVGIMPPESDKASIDPDADMAYMTTSVSQLRVCTQDLGAPASALTIGRGRDWAPASDAGLHSLETAFRGPFLTPED